MAPKLEQIVETILYTDDAPRLAQWYKDVMGLEPFMESKRAAMFALPNSTLLLLFDRNEVTEDKECPGEGVIPKHGCPTGLGQHIAFGCGGLDEIAEWEAHFKAKQVPIIATMDWKQGGRSLYVKDSEGHVIEVITRGVWKAY